MSRFVAGYVGAVTSAVGIAVSIVIYESGNCLGILLSRLYSYLSETSDFDTVQLNKAAMGWLVPYPIQY